MTRRRAPTAEPKVGRPTVLVDGPLAAMVEHAGGVGELAEALGVGRTTLLRWGTGATEPSVLGKRAANAWASRRGLPVPFPETK